MAEYHRIPWTENVHEHTFEFYDQSRDTMFRLTWDQLMDHAEKTQVPPVSLANRASKKAKDARTGADPTSWGPEAKFDILILRPNI